MLDLKRPCWNCHALKSVKRKGSCLYGHPGLRLPSHNFWIALQTDPGQLTQTLSESEDARETGPNTGSTIIFVLGDFSLILCLPFPLHPE